MVKNIISCLLAVIEIIYKDKNSTSENKRHTKKYINPLLENVYNR